MPKNINKKATKPSSFVVPEPNYVSDLIKRYMKAQQLTSDDVAEKLSCTGANIRMKLTRPIKKWPVSDIILLCNAVNCPVSEAYELLPRN